MKLKLLQPFDQGFKICASEAEIPRSGKFRSLSLNLSVVNFRKGGLKAFTVVELLVVMGIILLLYTISTLSWGKFQNEGNLDETAIQIKSFITQARMQSVNGIKTGVYFQNNMFVLYYTDSYVAGDPKNVESLLPKEQTIVNINLPASSVTFNKITGYVINFSVPENLILKEPGTGKQRVITINKLGLVEIN